MPPICFSRDPCADHILEIPYHGSFAEVEHQYQDLLRSADLRCGFLPGMHQPTEEIERKNVRWLLYGNDFDALTTEKLIQSRFEIRRLSEAAHQKQVLRAMISVLFD